MKSWNPKRGVESRRLVPGAQRLISVLLVCSPSVFSQAVPASISTIQVPTGGSPVFDAFRNSYYLGLIGQPTAGAAQAQSGGGTCSFPGFHGAPIPGPCGDAMVLKLDALGNTIWGTRLGGPTDDVGTALALDANGNVAITGSTGGQFPTTPRAAIASSSSAKAFAAKVSADGSKFLYSTYLPDSVAASSAIAVDASGNAYVGGRTSTGHAVVVKLNADGSSVFYNVTLGGSSDDLVTAIAVDAAGNAVVAGQTMSPDFPVTPGAFQPRLKGSRNGFLVRLSPSGSILTSTYFGGSGLDKPSLIAIDTAGNIDLAGYTNSLDLPTTPGTMQSTAIIPAWNNFGPDGFVAQFAADGNSLKWASYVMSAELPRTGADKDIGVVAMGVGEGGDIYLSGLTGAGFPVTPSAPINCFQGSTNRANGFLAHLNSAGALMDATYVGNSNGGDIYVAGLMPLPDGTALIKWSDSTPTPFLSKVQFGSGGSLPSACLSSDVLHAATLSGSGGIVPGELITLTGFGIGPDIGAVYQPDPQGNIPKQLGGVQVFFDGVPVPILYAQSQQINAIAPSGLPTSGTTQVTVVYNDRQFGPVVANTVFGNPGIFRLQFGQSSQAVAINQDGTLNGPSNPAPRGSYVELWGTGYGPTNPSCQTGGLNLPYAAPLGTGRKAQFSRVDQYWNGGPAVQADYAGSAPTLVCGVTQINFQVPADATLGTYYFLPWTTLGDGDTRSQSDPPIGVSIAVK